MADSLQWLKAPPVRVSIPPAEVVREQSGGEVTSPETLDYRTLTPVPGGLFCERIFGPLQELKCACGATSTKGFAPQVCPHCGATVAGKEDRKDRLGHIELAAPVCHPEYLRAAAQPLAHWCGLQQPVLEGLVYYSLHLVLSVDPSEIRQRQAAVLQAIGTSGAPDSPSLQETKEILERMETLSAGEVLTPAEADPLRRLRSVLAAPMPGAFKRMLDLGTGAEAVRELLHRAGSPDRGRAVLECLPVIPPGAREIRILDERRLLIHEVNDLYRRVIHRSSRLRKLAELPVPEAIGFHERRRLQEVVDALVDNARSPQPLLNDRGRPLKSLADLAEGRSVRQGLLRDR